MAKRKLLNVRSHLEFEIWAIDVFLKDNDKNQEPSKRYTRQGLVLPPFYVDVLRDMRFIASRILNKHASKKTRKDIYVEAK